MPAVVFSMQLARRGTLPRTGEVVSRDSEDFHFDVDPAARVRGCHSAGGWPMCGPHGSRPLTRDVTSFEFLGGVRAPDVYEHARRMPHVFSDHFSACPAFSRVFRMVLFLIFFLLFQTEHPWFSF